MNLSLGELEALCRKAARGAGYSWGLAEEAGRAVRWLQARQMDGARALADLCECDVRACPSLPNCSEDGPFCPLVTGAAICDHAHLLDQGDWHIGPLAHALLVMPFVDWAGAECEVTVDAGTVSMTVTKGTVLRLTPQVSRADLSQDVYQRLNTLACKTYAPATEASRISGAGAGLTDND